MLVSVFEMDIEFKSQECKLRLLLELVVGKIVVEASDEELPGTGSSTLFTCVLSRNQGETGTMCLLPSHAQDVGPFRFNIFAVCSVDVPLVMMSLVAPSLAAV